MGTFVSPAEVQWKGKEGHFKDRVLPGLRLRLGGGSWDRCANQGAGIQGTSRGVMGRRQDRVKPDVDSRTYGFYSVTRLLSYTAGHIFVNYTPALSVLPACILFRWVISSGCPRDTSHDAGL